MYDNVSLFKKLYSWLFRHYKIYMIVDEHDNIVYSIYKRIMFMEFHMADVASFNAVTLLLYEKDCIDVYKKECNVWDLMYVKE